MKRVILAIGGIVAVLALLIARLPFLFNANEFRPRIEADLTSVLGRKVELGSLKLSLFSGSLTASNLSIADERRFSIATDGAPFLRAQSLDLGVDLWPLITSHELNIRDLTITEPEISLMQDAAGVWNFSTVGPATGGTEAPLDLSVKLISLANGRVSIGRLGTPQKPMVLEGVNIALKDFAPGARFPFSFTGKLAPAGNVKLDGTAGPINAADASLTPVQFNVKISTVDIAGLGITANSALAGLLSIDGAGSINGTTLDWKGLVHIDQAKFVRGGAPAKAPVEMNITIAHNLQTHAGVLSQGDIRLGKSLASLTGSYTASGEVTNVKLQLKGSAMPIDALNGILPAFERAAPGGLIARGRHGVGERGRNGCGDRSRGRRDGEPQ